MTTKTNPNSAIAITEQTALTQRIERTTSQIEFYQDFAKSWVANTKTPTFALMSAGFIGTAIAVNFFLPLIESALLLVSIAGAGLSGAVAINRVVKSRQSID